MTQPRQNADAIISDIIVRHGELSTNDFAAMLAGGAPAGYEPFRTFMEGDYTYEKACIKAAFHSNGQNPARLRELKAIIDVPDIYDSGSAEVPARGEKIFFKRKFNIAPEVNITLKGGLVMSAPRITEITAEYFVVELADAGNSTVAGSISWFAQGY